MAKVGNVFRVLEGFEGVFEAVTPSANLHPFHSDVSYWRLRLS